MDINSNFVVKNGLTVGTTPVIAANDSWEVGTPSSLISVTSDSRAVTFQTVIPANITATSSSQNL